MADIQLSVSLTFPSRLALKSKFMFTTFSENNERKYKLKKQTNPKAYASGHDFKPDKSTYFY